MSVKGSKVPLFALPVGFHWGGSQVMEVILAASWITKLVLVVLLIFSVVSWAIILYKYRFFRRAKQATRQFLRFFGKGEEIVAIKREAEHCTDSPLAALFLEGYRRFKRMNSHSRNGDETGLKSLERSLRGTIQDEITHHEGYLSFLATTGNVSPFVGLFGTVLGIIDAFQEIGRQGTANIAAVAPGLAEALVATAAGLFAAIPAVVAYNFYMNRIRLTASQMEAFSMELMDLFEEQREREEVLKT